MGSNARWLGRWALALVLAIGLVQAEPAPAAETAKTADEIEDCVRDNLPDRSSVQTVLFRARDRNGSKKDSRARIYWKKDDADHSRVMIRVSAPPKLRGTGVLMIEKDGDSSDRFLYLPSLRKVRRITKSNSSGTFLNTDFTYDDLERIHGLGDDRESRRLDDGENGLWVLESRPAEGADGEYERAVSEIDPATCVVLKTRFFERGDKLRKVLTAEPSEVKDVGGHRIPHLIRMEDVREESSTDLIVEEIRVGAEIPERTFSRKELAVGRRE